MTEPQSKIVEVPGVGNVEFPITMSDEEIATILARQAGSIPSRVMSGLAESGSNAVKGAVGIAKGIVGTIAHPVESIKHIPDLVSNLATGMVSYPEQLASEIRQDPWKGGARTVGDVLQLLASRGAGAGGKALGKLDVPPTPGPILGATPFAMETGTGIMPSFSRMLVRSPIGSQPAAKLGNLRNAAVVKEAENLLGGIPEDTQIIGGNAVVALKKAYKNTERVENSLWNPLKTKAAQLGIETPLTATKTLAEPEYLRGLAAHEAVKSNLSPTTQRVLIKIAAPKPEEAAGDLTGQLALPENYIDRLPPSQRQQFLDTQAQLSQGAAEAPPSWLAVHQARTEIGRLIHSAEKRASLGSNDATALDKIYDGLTQDLQDSLPPDLRADFADASAYTKAQKSLYGSSGTLTEDYMKSEPKVMPSQTIDELLNGTPESAANFRMSLGNNTPIKQQVARGVIGKLINSANGGELNPTNVLDGPKFAKLYTDHRGVIEHLVDPDTLRRWDVFAKEVSKYQLTKGAAGSTEAGGGISGRIASMMEYGTLMAGAEAAFKGHPIIGASIGLPLMTARSLVNIMLQPAGPGLLARYLHTGQWSTTLGRMAEGTGYASVVSGEANSTKR